MDDGSLVEVDLRSRTEAQAFWNGSFEPDYVACLKELISVFEGATYDIGANVGLVAIPLARHSKTKGAPVIAFEPVPENHARLVRNAALNGLGPQDLQPLPFALSAESGRSWMSREAQFNAGTGNARLLETGGAPERGAHRVEVSVARLDDLVSELDLPLPAVIKLDVEGAETGVIRGAERTLSLARPVILGEFNSNLMPLFGTSFPEAAGALPPDYQIFSFLAADVIIERQAIIGLGDVLLVPAEKVASIPLRVGC